MLEPIEFFNKYINDFKTVGNELTAKYCPFCDGGQKHDTYTFSLNKENLAYQCLRGSCGVKGKYVQLVNKLAPDLIVSKKEYKPIIVETVNLSDVCLKYINNRKISIDTINHFKLSSKNNKTIVFPYYKDKILVFVKYKTLDGNSKMYAEKDGMPVLFGMDYTDDSPLVITEGEFDCLSVYEAGWKNVVSIPNGVKGFTWIDTCWDYINDYKEIIIWGDNDKAGNEFVKEVSNKLGAWRCKIVTSNFKDANECLEKFGKKYVMECINNAKFQDNDFLIDLSTVDCEQPANIPKTISKIEPLDRALKGFRFGEITLWSGENSSGKTTIVSQLMLQTIQQDINVCVFSGEITSKKYKNWLYLQAIGRRGIAMIKDKYLDNVFNATTLATDRQKVNDWIAGRYIWFNHTKSMFIEDVIPAFQYANKRYNCKVFLIDNLMMLYSRENHDSVFVMKSEIVGKLIEFCHEFDCHVHLVAHPKKTEGKATKKDVAGSFEITNRVDNVIMCHREENGAILQVLKNRFYGEQDIDIPLDFCNVSKRFYRGQLDDKPYFNERIYDTKELNLEGTEEKVPW